jgi:hypothetical protein
MILIYRALMILESAGPVKGKTAKNASSASSASSSSQSAGASKTPSAVVATPSAPTSTTPRARSKSPTKKEDSDDKTAPIEGATPLAQVENLLRHILLKHGVISLDYMTGAVLARKDDKGINEIFNVFYIKI